MKNRNLTRLLILLTVISLLAFTTSCASINPAHPDATDHAVSVMYGQQAFDEEQIDDDVRADSFGIQYEYVNPPGAFGDEDAPIVSEVGFLYGTSSATSWVGTPSGGVSNEFDVGLDTYEVYLGIRKDWHMGRFTPFFGGGLDITVASAEAFGGHDEDSAVGGYLKTGTRYRVTDHLSIGAEARYRMLGDVQFSNEHGSVEGELDGLSALITLTWSF